MLAELGAAVAQPVLVVMREEMAEAPTGAAAAVLVHQAMQAVVGEGVGEGILICLRE